MFIHLPHVILFRIPYEACPTGCTSCEFKHNVEVAECLECESTFLLRDRKCVNGKFYDYRESYARKKDTLKINTFERSLNTDD